MNKEALKSKKEKYAGPIVLGINDAIIELSGALIGLTVALRNNILVASTGIILGIAASLSMAVSEYLSAEEEGRKKPLKLATYTGLSYLITVLILITPYLFLKNSYTSSIIMLILVLATIGVYTYYISSQKKSSFSKRFFKMAGISLSVAAISFVVGILIRKFTGINV